MPRVHGRFFEPAWPQTGLVKATGVAGLAGAQGATTVRAGTTGEAGIGGAQGAVTVTSSTTGGVSIAGAEGEVDVQ